MASAMRAWGEWSPKAILVSSRILVFVDSMSPAGNDLWRLSGDKAFSSHAPPENRKVGGSTPPLATTRNRRPQCC